MSTLCDDYDELDAKDVAMSLPDPPPRVDSFGKWAIPLIRSVLFDAVLEGLITTQPMAAPDGRLFYLDFACQTEDDGVGRLDATDLAVVQDAITVERPRTELQAYVEELRAFTERNNARLVRTAHNAGVPPGVLVRG